MSQPRVPLQVFQAGVGLAIVGHVTVDDPLVRALAIDREIGDRRSEGNHLGNLGLAYRALGQVPKAIAYMGATLAILEDIQDTRAEQARKLLEDLKQQAGTAQ